jgi:flagellar protein FliO/FliZ
MSVLARQQLSRTSSVAVLRVMDRALVLGVTEQGIRLITETELSPIEDALATEPAPNRAWSVLRPARAELPDGGADSGADGGADSGSAGGFAGDEVEVAGHGDIRVAGGRRKTVPATRGRGTLDGSVLSAQTWRQLLNAARELTVRR